MGQIIEKNQRSTISCYCTFKEDLSTGTCFSKIHDVGRSLEELEQQRPAYLRVDEVVGQDDVEDRDEKGGDGDGGGVDEMTVHLAK